MYSVLIAEDEAVMRIAISNMLESNASDFKLVAAVSNGAEALAYIRSHPVDIVITDLMMPVMDGLDLIQTLKEEGWGGAILVLSNYADFELARSALKRGANDYLLKLDIDAQTLEKHLAETVSHIGERSVPFKPDNKKESFHASLISVHNNTGQPDANAPSERALTVIKQMFAENDAMFDVIDEHEVFLLIPAHAHKDIHKQIIDKLHRTVRQIKIYLNLDTKALFLKEAIPQGRANEMYQRLESASELLFSGSSREVICLEDISYNALPKEFDSFRKEVREAMLFIHFNYQSTITLDDVAKSVNLNRDYLCRLFKKETGLQMFRYLSNLRMQRAATLLAENPDRSYIRDVACAVGIDDQFYFTRVFKKYHGISPSEYGKDVKG